MGRFLLVVTGSDFPTWQPAMLSPPAGFGQERPFRDTRAIFFAIGRWLAVNQFLSWQLTTE